MSPGTAYFRYRHLPHAFVPFNPSLRNKIVTKAPVIPKVVWPGSGGKVVLADSTPMILRIERETGHLGRKIVLEEPWVDIKSGWVI